MREDHSSIRTKFFKIMLPGFDERLKLPPVFCEKVKHVKSKRAILESCKGKWEINVRREDDDQIVLEDGWPRFADEHDLSLRDFLVFEHTGKLHFKVIVFDVTACQKKYPIDPDNEHQTIYPTSNHAKKKASLRSQSPCFSHVLTHFSVTKKGAACIPAEFGRSNNLEQKKGATLKDPRRGRKWRVKLCVRTWPKFRASMSTGWHDFVAANNLQVGDLCTFQLIHAKPPTSKYISFDVRISRNTNR